MHIMRKYGEKLETMTRMAYLREYAINDAIGDNNEMRLAVNAQKFAIETRHQLHTLLNQYRQEILCLPPLETFDDLKYRNNL